MILTESKINIPVVNEIEVFFREGMSKEEKEIEEVHKEVAILDV